MTKIILVPGLLCSPRLWQFQVDALDGEHEVRVFDHRRDDDYAAMAERLLDEVPGSFALVGLSMGGYLAQEVVWRAPDRVERLALTCTRSEPDTEEVRNWRMQKVAEAADGRFEAVAAELGQGWFAERNRTPVNRALLADMARHTGYDAFCRQQKAIAGRRDMRPLLGLISCPTLVLCGSEDRLTVPEGHVAMARAIPDADLVVLGGCGHLAPLERPDAVTDAFRAWLRR